MYRHEDSDPQSFHNSDSNQLRVEHLYSSSSHHDSILLKNCKIEKGQSLYNETIVQHIQKMVTLGVGTYTEPQHLNC